MRRELNDLVSNADIADLLGVSRAAVSNWVARGVNFPKPLVRVSGGNVPLWDRYKVLSWAAQTGRVETGHAVDLARGWEK